MRNIFLVIALGGLCSCTTGDKKKAEEVSVANINGEELFKSNCASCHKCFVDFTGPALKGSLERWKDKELMYKFIRNPFSAMQDNEYAKGLQKKYGIIMPASSLSDQELDAIFNFCGNADSVESK